MRRTQPLHPAAFLVDQDRRIGVARQLAQFLQQAQMTCAGVSMLRLNRIKPHGRSRRMNSRSAALSSSPDMPVMNARLLMGAD